MMSTGTEAQGVPWDRGGMPVSPQQHWLRWHCQGQCGAPAKHASIIPRVLFAKKCPCLEMLKRG